MQLFFSSIAVMVGTVGVAFAQPSPSYHLAGCGWVPPDVSCVDCVTQGWDCHCDAFLHCNQAGQQCTSYPNAYWFCGAPQGAGNLEVYWFFAKCYSAKKCNNADGSHAGPCAPPGYVCTQSDELIYGAVRIAYAAFGACECEAHE